MVVFIYKKYVCDLIAVVFPHFPQPSLPCHFRTPDNCGTCASKVWRLIWKHAHGTEYLTLKNLPSRGLTYPTLGKGKSSSKCHFWGICYFPGEGSWWFFPNPSEKICNRQIGSFSQGGPDEKNTYLSCHHLEIESYLWLRKSWTAWRTWIWSLLVIT